ncbi:SDR family NAD(P)-dependent oxidoreductase (plasmid) [Rhizobium ruizarguesonis]|nr:SDR family NAD(P)-dependent oxidoreductase [Rhizobium ruizarguesonis]
MLDALFLHSKKLTRNAMNEAYVLIVGAGPGLGLAIAREFGRDIKKVALFARSEENLSSLAKSLNSEGIEVKTKSVDAADLVALEAATEEILADWGAPRVVVYHGATVVSRRPLALPSSEFARELVVNVVGAHLVTSTVAPKMTEGTILYTGGGFAMYPSADYASLSAGKAALKNLAESAAGDLLDRGVHLAVINICGFVEPTGNFSVEQIAKKYGEMHLQGRDEWKFEYNYV